MTTSEYFSTTIVDSVSGLDATALIVPNDIFGYSSQVVAAVAARRMGFDPEFLTSVPSISFLADAILLSIRRLEWPTDNDAEIAARVRKWFEEKKVPSEAAEQEASELRFAEYIAYGPTITSSPFGLYSLGAMATRVGTVTAAPAAAVVAGAGWPIVLVAGVSTVTLIAAAQGIRNALQKGLEYHLLRQMHSLSRRLLEYDRSPSAGPPSMKDPRW